MNPQISRNVADFGMDTITLAGPLEAKLQAVRAAGFTQIMLAARDIVGHPGGMDVAVQAVRDSGLRVTGFQVLRDFFSGIGVIKIQIQYFQKILSQIVSQLNF